jgi:Mn2+/Fe2+ NRAMP family transporter
MLSFLVLVAEVAGFSLLFRRVLGLPLAIGPALYVCATILIVYFSDFLRLPQTTGRVTLGLWQLPYWNKCA